MDITDLLTKTVNLGASDLHLRAGLPPKVRVSGKLKNLDDQLGVSDYEFLYEILNDVNRKHFEEKKELDFAYAIPGLSRFRVNFLKCMDGLGAVFRVVPDEIKTLDDLKFLNC